MTATEIAGDVSRDTSLSLVDPDPSQPRRSFDDAKLAELADSMAANGLVCPILLRPAGDRLVIVHGERRWRAALRLGWSSVPAVVRDVDPADVPWVQLVENVQRADLSPVEEAQAYRARLADGMTHDQLATRVGKSRTHVTQKLRLLTLPAALQVYLDRGGLTEGHARQLLKLRSVFDGILLGEALDFDRLAEIPTDGDPVFPLLRDLRPEDTPPTLVYWVEPCTGVHAQAITDATSALVEDLCTHREATERWSVVAFWHASTAVRFGMSVADLAVAVDNYVDRLLSAVLWWTCMRGGTDPRAAAREAPESVSEMDWWGYESDLRHAGVLPHVDRLLRAHADRIHRLVLSQRITVASAYQGWGFQRDAYQARMDAEGRL